MRRFRNFTLSAIALFLVDVASASELECNRQQSECVTNNSSLTLGDRVGVFNKDNEIVAVGRVKAMDGDRRTVKISKSYGTIYNKDQVALLNANVQGTEDIEGSYAVFSPNPPYNYGGSIGIVSMSVGEYLSGLELSGYIQKRLLLNLSLVLRTSVIAARGKIARDHDYLDIKAKEISYLGMALLPGVAMSLMEQSKLSLRAEIAGGGVYSSAAVGGDSSLVSGQGFDTKVSNGFGLILRAGVSVQLNFKTFRSEIILAQGLINKARASSISIGVDKDIN